jgi:D-inositol-3-phosphate glycosyltransferase
MELRTAPILLVVADAGNQTGFGRVADSLLRRLHRDFEIHHFGINYCGPELHDIWTTHPVPLDASKLDVLYTLVNRLKPDIAFFINDLHVINEFAAALSNSGHRPQMVAYFPIDSEPIEPELLLPAASLCDVLVTYTRFGESQIRKLYSQSRASGKLEKDVQILVIPHGVDNSEFYPLCGDSTEELRQSKLLARKQILPSLPPDAFLVLNANRNQPRKRIDITMKAFALFAKNKPPSVMLYLHMGREDEGWNLTILARRLGILNRLVLTTTKRYMPAVSTATLNVIYNACDVGLNTSSAEGWGLVSFEHGAVGRPQVVPGHTSQIELWGGIGRTVPPRFVVCSERSLTNVYLLAPEDVATELETLYEDRGLRHEVGQACFMRSREALFSWDRIADKWRETFNCLCDRTPRFESQSLID